MIRWLVSSRARTAAAPTGVMISALRTALWSEGIKVSTGGNEGFCWATPP